MKPQSPSTLFSTTSRSRGAASSRLISIRLPEDLLRRLAEVGNEEGLAMSDTIRVVLERGLSASNRKKGK